MADSAWEGHALKADGATHLFGLGIGELGK